MNKTWLIVRHEFYQLVRQRSFIVLTLLFPLIGFGAIGVNQLVQSIDSADPAEITAVGYVDEVGWFENDGDIGNLSFAAYDDREEAKQALLVGDVDEYFVIPEEYLATGNVVRFTLAKEVEFSDEMMSAMRVFLQDGLLEGRADPEIMARVKSPLFLSNVRLDEAGNIATDQGGIFALVVPLLFGLLLVMAIGMSSGFLLQGLGEEKENRIMEVLLSSVSTRQLLAGKVLGLGAGGLLQVVVWLVSTLLLVRLAGDTIGGDFLKIQVPGNIVLLGIVYFILGYLLFAVLQAGVGAIAGSAKEGQQMSVAFILPAVLPIYVFILFLRDRPDHIVGTILTLVPITAPMTVFVRMGLSEIPTWQLLASIGLLVVSVVFGLVLAAKLFRVFVLMHGKTPRLREVVRYLRQS
ncbi:MAG: ABC transporter permease [Dehalococcoidales bacterium]